MADVIEIAGIDTIFRRSEKKDAGTVVIFHGFGADMNDLFPLCEMMDPKSDFNWYFPNGILDVVIAPGYRGRAWYPVNMARLEEMMRTGKIADLSNTRPEGIDTAVGITKDFLAAVGGKSGKLVIGGFSQGAMLSTELSFQYKGQLKGIVLMSGGLIDEKSWTEKTKFRSGIPYIQSHGTTDPILSFESAKKLNKILNHSGWRGDFVSFTGGHEIPQQVLSRVAAFLSKQLK